MKDRMIVKAAIMAALPVLNKLPQDKLDDPEALSAWADEHPFNLEEGLQLLQLYKATVLASLMTWSLPIPIPQTLAEVEEMPADIYDALEDAVRGEALTKGAETDFSVNPDESSPTEPSGGSSGPLRASTETPQSSTGEPSSSGTSTATGKPTSSPTSST
jgi:hypothetical protein